MMLPGISVGASVENGTRAIVPRPDPPRVNGAEAAPAIASRSIVSPVVGVNRTSM